MPALPKLLAPAIICLCLSAWSAAAETMEQVQEQLVDSMARAGQAAEQANKKLKTDDITGACNDLRTASTESARTIELGEQITQRLKTDTSVSDINRDRMRLDLVNILTNVTLQKRSLDTQISARCN